MSNPTLVVGVNKFGFSILEVAFRLAATNDTRELAYVLIENVCSAQDAPFGDEYHQVLTEVFKDTENPYRQFFVGDNLVWLKLTA